MANRKRAIPQYGTVTLNGLDYYRTRVQDADGKLVALYARTPEELYDNPMIELRAISEDNFRECLLLRASVENEDFVDPVTYSLAEAWVYYQDTRPFAIYSDDTIVGFVSMYVGEDNYQIINFLIDDAFQRKGYGSKAVKLCIEYLQREFSACRISAPVKMEHIAAQEFWIKQGFCLSDTIEDGYVFMRLFLT